MIIEAIEYDPSLFGKLICISKVSTRELFIVLPGFTIPSRSVFLYLFIYDSATLGQKSAFKKIGRTTQMLIAPHQDFRKFIKANESSLSAHFARQFLPQYQFLATCQFLPKRQLLPIYAPLKSSRSTSIPLSLPPRTLRWLDELYQRFFIANELVNKRFREVIATIDEFFPNLDNEGYCRDCLTLRVAAFQRLSVHLLFRIFDARHDNSQSGRLAQERVIEGMAALELAAVNFLLSTTSIYYSYNAICDCERSIEVQREIQSVFRELALRHGPKLIWASLFGTDLEKRRIGKRIEKGLVELRAYETSMGVNVSELIVSRSLQSVLMREFCRKKQCDVVDGWNVIFEVVKDEVLFPDKNQPHSH